MGAYRLSGEHFLYGAPLDEITDTIPSTNEQISVRLGGLALFGQKKRRGGISGRGKLAVVLESDTLEDESRRYAKEYENQGLPLRSYPGDGEYSPHCSIAAIHANADHFADEYTLNRLGGLSDLGFSSKLSIKLDPVRRHAQAAAPLPRE